MIKPSDIKGLSQLATDSVSGITNIVANMHKTIDRTPGLFGATTLGPIGAITDIVYQSIHAVNNVVRNGIETIVEQIEPLFEDKITSLPEREAILAAINGVLGDYLVEQKNPLALPMTLKYKGKPLNLETLDINTQIPEFSGKLIVLVHGLCMNDNQWLYNNHDHGQNLANDLKYTPLYLHYNTGLHISINGRSFSDMLEKLLTQIRVKKFVILTHSMGGLITRSAYHYGVSSGYKWPSLLKKQIFLGTPHHGAPLEQGGNWINTLLDFIPHTAPFASLPKIRSAGITDLRYGSLLDEDWQSNDRFDNIPDNRHPIPLPQKVKNYAIAANISLDQESLKNDIIGDGLVPIDSALGKHPKPEYCLSFPESNCWIGYGLNHLDLLCHASVYDKIKQWCS
ncbi:MAG: alpha/beta hydrolase [Candidatus Magnetomorum sp.]|nr:alpha/beta hydrolase [Candidatus Magnetomorum sp.]